MRDEERRKKERAAEHGDERAAADLNREDDRRGAGLMGFLKELVGKQVWIEGVRINYRGVLLEVLKNNDGSPAGLVLFPFQRVSYFQNSGPNASTTYDHTHPHLVPYECIHDVGEDGLAQGSWPRLKT